jgi:hypothetical protein
MVDDMVGFEELRAVPQGPAKYLRGSGCDFNGPGSFAVDIGSCADEIASKKLNAASLGT